MSKQVLVVDDDPAIRKSFVLALEDTDYQVDTAASGELGIEMASGNKYDLIFLDLKMPGINGVDTLIRLRELGLKIPIYILTAFHREFTDQLRVAAENGVAFELFKKPLGAQEIRMVTKSILGRVEDAREVCNV